MQASSLFRLIDERVPPGLAVPNDLVGYLGKADPAVLQVNSVLMLLDYLPPPVSGINYHAYDLLVLHHPPLEPPVIPSFVIHSNWDIVPGGACDALAERLSLIPSGVLDEDSGIGRMCEPASGPVTMGRFVTEVQRVLRISGCRTVMGERDRVLRKIALVSGFGLNTGYIRLARSREADLLLSGDLTHPGAILAKMLRFPVIDATHHATELPGLYTLKDLLESLGISVRVYDPGVPWNESSSLLPSQRMNHSIPR